MVRWTTLLGLVCALPATAAAQPRAEEAGGLRFGEPIQYHNLTLVPVSTNKPGPYPKYTLLEAGLKTKTLAVRELDGASTEARVSEVQVRNRGKYAAFLLGGEMILGGKQDRIIEADSVVPNDGKWHSVKVFCVEHGRWAGGDMRFKGGQALAHVGLRKAAMSGDQSAVWAEVARKNEAHGTENETGTYRRTIQNSLMRERITKHRLHLLRRLPKDPQLAGFVFAINGEIRAADLFGNPSLFGDLKNKLVSAYVLEALEHQVDPNAPKLGKGKARKFFDKARKAPKSAPAKSGRATNYKKKLKGLLGNETVDEGTKDVLRETYIKE